MLDESFHKFVIDLDLEAREFQVTNLDEADYSDMPYLLEYDDDIESHRRFSLMGHIVLNKSIQLLRPD